MIYTKSYQTFRKQLLSTSGRFSECSS